MKKSDLIQLSLSSLTKSQQKQSYIQMSYSTTIARLPTPALATMHPSGGFIPYMTLTSFNFLAGDKELRNMPVFLMGMFMAWMDEWLLNMDLANLTKDEVKVENWLALNFVSSYTLSNFPIPHK